MADKNRTPQPNQQAQGRQQQQFERPSGQAGGNPASDARLIDQVRERMPVLTPDGKQVGTVDHVDGDRIKLTRTDSPDGQHHYLTTSQIGGIENGQIRLSQQPDWQR